MSVMKNTCDRGKRMIRMVVVRAESEWGDYDDGIKLIVATELLDNSGEVDTKKCRDYYEGKK